MRVGFSNKFVFTPTWNKNLELPANEQIKVTMKPLNTGDLIALLDSIGEKKDVGAGLTGAEIAKLINMIGPIVQSSVVVDGLEDDEGVVDAPRMVKYPRYMMLTSEILWKLAEISMPSEKTEGNSGAQPA